MSTSTKHRLEGLEADNVLAFLALLGVLRALEAVDKERSDSEKWLPRVAWDTKKPPLRPVLFVQSPVETSEVSQRVADGVAMLQVAYDFNSRKDLNHSEKEARELLMEKLDGDFDPDTMTLFEALFSDAAIKTNKKDPVVDPTPLCLLFGQGHQHFLERLASIPKELAPPPRGRGKQAKPVTAEECLTETLFKPWHRTDPTDSMRWDPEEDVRYALMAGNPTVPAYKSGTQHGANRLAVIGLAALTLVPEKRAGQVRPVILGGSYKDGFSLSWPVWSAPASLSAIRGMLAHPGLLKPKMLTHLGVEYVLSAKRISNGKFMNFTRASVLQN